MKECPICHAVYDDSLNFCVKDGHELIEKSATSQHVEPSGPVVDSTQRVTKLKKGGCLKKVIIGAVVVLIGLIVLYRYIMNAATYLRVEPNSVVAAKCGGNINIDIDYDGYVWTINHKPDWVTIDENDKDFELTFAPNISGSMRQGTITVQSGNLLAQVELSQKAHATYIKPSVSMLKFDKSGGRKTVNVESDGTKWTVEYPQFLNVETSGDSFTVEVSSNDGDYRHGIITLTEDHVRTSISFQQAGKCPNCQGQGSLTCSSCGGLGTTGYGIYSMQCVWCGGRGSINCAACGGAGEKE